MSKASNARDRAKSSPAALGTIGALAGGTLGMMLAKKARDRRRESWEGSHYIPAGGFRTESSYVSRDYVAEPAYTPRTGAYPDYSAAPEVSTFGAESWSEPYRSPTAEESWRSAPTAEESWESAAGPSGEPSKADRLKEKGAELKGKSSELKEKASHKAADLKHRMADKTGELRNKTGELRHKTGELRHKTGELRHKMQERSSHGAASHLKERMPSATELKQGARERPFGVILGGMAIGALAASLLPLSRRERKTMHPAKEKARHEIEDQFSNIQHKVQDKLGFGGESHGQEQRRYSSPSGSQSSGATRPAEGGSFVSAETSGTYASATSDDTFLSSTETTSREDLGLRSEADEPYRQPSLAEQLENKDKIH